jgi:hypothetical protein
MNFHPTHSLLPHHRLLAYGVAVELLKAVREGGAIAAKDKDPSSRAQLYRSPAAHTSCTASARQSLARPCFDTSHRDASDCQRSVVLFLCPVPCSCSCSPSRSPSPSRWPSAVAVAVSVTGLCLGHRLSLGTTKGRSPRAEERIRRAPISTGGGAEGTAKASTNTKSPLALLGLLAPWRLISLPPSLGFDRCSKAWRRRR